jgi:hypothetical protein
MSWPSTTNSTNGSLSGLLSDLHDYDGGANSGKVRAAHASCFLSFFFFVRLSEKPQTWAISVCTTTNELTYACIQRTPLSDVGVT